jgi:dipeptidyl aminopeptidase/acylaminoacyl peptidase
MQKSVYQSIFFPETRADRFAFHTSLWIKDTLIPFIQKDFKLLLRNQNNFLFGISTGGRGVGILAEKTGDLFKAGAALSGDYDQTLMNNDKLMISYYGYFADFPERWKTIDNPLHNSDQLKIPLFLAHGENDKIVPVQQTKVFYENIKLKSHLNHVINIVPDAGHDYRFWESQYRFVFDFFKKNK